MFIVSVAVQNFNEVPRVYFCLYFHYFRRWVIEDLAVILCRGVYCLRFPVRALQFLALHFEFFFACGVRRCSSFILSPVAVRFQAPLLPLNLTGTSRVLVGPAPCQALLGSSSPGRLEVPAHSLFQGRREGTAPDPAQEGAACQNGAERGGGCGCWRLGAPLRCKTQLSDTGSAWLETARLRAEGLGSGGQSC